MPKLYFVEIWPDEWEQICEECLHQTMEFEDDKPIEPKKGDLMSTDLVDGQTLTKSGRPRKPKRVGPDGKPMRRLVLVLSSSNYDRVTAAILLRSSPLFNRIYQVAEISKEGTQEETFGRAIAAICDSWHYSIEKQTPTRT